MNLSEANILLTGSAGQLANSVIAKLIARTGTITGLDRTMVDSGLIQQHAVDLVHFEKTAALVDQLFIQQDYNVLINMAGKIHNELLVNLFDKNDPKHKESHWVETIESNLTSTFNVSRCFVHNLIKKRKKGIIINVSSVSAQGVAGQSAYSAAKAGVEALTRCWSKELAPWGIRSCAIAPGFFDVGSTHKSLTEQKLNQIISEIPMKRLGQSDELAKTIIFAIENDYLNGEVIKLNGGL